MLELAKEVIRGTIEGYDRRTGYWYIRSDRRDYPPIRLLLDRAAGVRLHSGRVRFDATLRLPQPASLMRVVCRVYATRDMQLKTTVWASEFRYDDVRRKIMLPVEVPNRGQFFHGEIVVWRSGVLNRGRGYGLVRIDGQEELTHIFWQVRTGFAINDKRSVICLQRPGMRPEQEPRPGSRVVLKLRVVTRGEHMGKYEGDPWGYERDYEFTLRQLRTLPTVPQFVYSSLDSAWSMAHYAGQPDL